MKLKYYLRGIGIGVILTATIMGFALGGRKTIMSDAQVIQRAKELGMTEGGVLSDSEKGDNNSSAYTSLSVETLDKTDKERVEEVNKAVAAAGKSSSKEETKEKEEKTTDTKNESDKNKSEATSSSTETAKNTVTQEASTKETTKNESDSKEEKKEENTTVVDTVKSDETVKVDSNEAEDASNETETKEIETSETSDDKTEVAQASQSEENSDNEDTEVSTNAEYTTSISKTITIPGGLGSDAVARLLYNEGVIDSAIAFDNYLTTNRLDRYIRSGVKNIPSGATYADIADILTKG
jgi:DNA polymerase III alpha subunit (gram-positive type)